MLRDQSKAFVYLLGLSAISTLWCSTFSPETAESLAPSLTLFSIILMSTCFIVMIIFLFHCLYFMLKNVHKHVLSTLEGERMKTKYVNLWGCKNTEKDPRKKWRWFYAAVEKYVTQSFLLQVQNNFTMFFRFTTIFFGTFSPTQLDTLWFYTLASAYKHLHNIFSRLFRRWWTEFIQIFLFLNICSSSTQFKFFLLTAIFMTPVAIATAHLTLMG